MKSEEIVQGVYLIKIPLPGNPLKELNSYFIKGEKNLLIDTGFNRSESEAAIFKQLDELGANLNETDLFITHMHSDHCGLVSKLAKHNTTIYCSEIDANIINYATTQKCWDELDELFLKYGFPEKAGESNTDSHPGKEYENKGAVDFTYVNDGDILEVGDYAFKCIHTPGHTPGLMCLHDEEAKIIICADHVLGNITPNICIDNDDEYPLQIYFDSLDRVKDIDVDYILTGHRVPPKSFSDRIDEIKNHHGERLNEILSILGDKELNAYEVAEKMVWQIKFKNWDAFPLAQKWFAMGEAAAHLNHLESLGEIVKIKKDGVFNFKQNTREQ